MKLALSVGLFGPLNMSLPHLGNTNEKIARNIAIVDTLACTPPSLASDADHPPQKRVSDIMQSPSVNANTVMRPFS